jgi:hypothetical protein
MSTMVSVETRKPAVSFVWSKAGFDRQDAAEWRQAGWSDPTTAAAWSATSPDDGPDVLMQLRDSGYSLDQLRHTARVTRRHVAAWTAALVRPAQVDVDDDLVIDLR